VVLKEKLREAGRTKNLEIVERVEKTYLFKGYEEHFRKMIPVPADQENAVFPIVFSHNDA